MFFYHLNLRDLNCNLNLYKNLFDKNTIFYSVLAGKNLSDVQKIFSCK